jgi:CDP-diacylglycerol--glycerol-3-phosphate 3-phosphatidyltransferase
MNLPNKITMVRIFMIPFVLLFMLPVSFIGKDSAWNVFIEDYGMLIATILFFIASLTDTIDGQLARKQGIVTNMGKFLDPIADKLLVTSVLIALVQINKISAIVAIIIICREFIVTGIRLLAADKNVVISASNLGKVKTVFQIIAIIIVMLEIQLSISFANSPFSPALFTVSQVMVWVAVLLTIISGIDYMRKNMSFLNE